MPVSTEPFSNFKLIVLVLCESKSVPEGCVCPLCPMISSHLAVVVPWSRKSDTVDVPVINTV